MMENKPFNSLLFVPTKSARNLSTFANHMKDCDAMFLVHDRASDNWVNALVEEYYKHRNQRRAPPKVLLCLNVEPPPKGRPSRTLSEMRTLSLSNPPDEGWIAAILKHWTP
jgi:hypothetical protein